MLPKITSKNGLPKLLPLETVNLSGLGEPLLNTQLTQIVEMLKRKNINVFFISNGQLLNTEIRKKIVNSGLDSIVISMESAKPKKYEAVRRGAKFIILRNNLELLRKDSKIPIEINSVIFDNKFKEVKDIINFAAQINARSVNLGIIDDVSSNPKIIKFLKNKQKYHKILDPLRIFAKDKGLRLYTPIYNPKKGNCSSPWLFPFLTVDGFIMPCCTILHLGLSLGKSRKEIVRKYSFGNINVDNLETIWNSNEAINFRKKFINGKLNEYCLRCSKYFGLK